LRRLLAGAAIGVVGIAGGGLSALAQQSGDPPPAPAAPAAPPAPPEAAPGPRDGQVLQNWTLHCQMAPPATEVCVMRQRLVDPDGNTVLLAVVGRLPVVDLPGLLILLPHSLTSLPPGAFLKIDQRAEQRVQIERCEPRGCHVELVLDDDLLPMFKAGSQATVGFFVYNERGQPQRVDVPISLIGFSAALAEVMK
jgi:invasion protein IalB